MFFSRAIQAAENLNPVKGTGLSPYITLLFKRGL
jgi:hypothetical protein